MCESISTDLDDAEFVQKQVTRVVDRMMVQHSEAGYPVDSSSYCASEVSDANQPRGEDDLDDDFPTDCVDSASSLHGNYDPVRSGEVSDLVDVQLKRSTTSEGLGRSSPVPDRVLEEVANNLRIIGDEMDSDIRRKRMLDRRRAAGPLPFRGLDVIIDLFPVPETSRKNLTVVRDLACETLARDLVNVAVRRVLVTAGSAFAHALFRELISNTVTCPVHFRFKWSAIKWSRWPVG